MEKWEHKKFWLNRSVTIHSPQKRAGTGDGFIELEVGTPLIKPRVNDSMREFARKLRKQSADHGSPRLYLPVKFARPHQWFSRDHVFYVDIDALDVAENP